MASMSCLQPFINLDRDITFGAWVQTRSAKIHSFPAKWGPRRSAASRRKASCRRPSTTSPYDTDSYNVFVDQQTLHEVYVAPFQAAVDAGVASMMCSYNRLNGPFACGNADTLKTILRDQIGFRGFVTSDWGAVHNVHFLNQGLTMEMPGEIPDDSPLAGMIHTYFRTRPNHPTPPAKPNKAAMAGLLGGTIPEETKGGGMDLDAFPKDSDPATMRDALADGSITEATVTNAARIVLYEIDRFGYLDGKQKHDVTAQDLEGNGKIIEKTAEDAAVLLKNEGGILPLKPADLASLAMIGPTAGQVDSIGTFGERSPGMPERQVGPLDAMRKLAPGANVTFAVADDFTGKTIAAGILSHGGKPGLVRTDADGKTSVDSTLDFTRKNGNSLAPGSTPTWSGTIDVPSEGAYWFYLQALGTRAILSIDGKETGRTGAARGTVHGDIQHASQDNGMPTTDGLDNVRRAVQLTAGTHTVEVTTSLDTSNAPVQVRLNWTTPASRRADHDAAIAAAKSSRVAVVFAWIRDKPHFELPGDQDALISEIANVNPNTVVVLNTSQPIAMPWEKKVKGILEMWWPGDEGGWATAKTLLGQNNPAGRLPMTWAKQLTDYAPNSPAHPERSSKGVDGRTTFSEGVLIGYRWFDAEKIEPLYPFGYGLSYTTFKMSDLRVTGTAIGGASISVRVKNTGVVAGDEVPQVYLEIPNQKPAGVQFAPKTLVAFGRVTLAPGEERELTLRIAPRAFMYWSVADRSWKTPAGPRAVLIGNSSRTLPLRAIIE